MQAVRAYLAASFIGALISIVLLAAPSAALAGACDDMRASIMRMERALSETHIEGVKTTVEFCREIMRDESFQQAGLGVDWLPRYLAQRVPTPA